MFGLQLSLAWKFTHLNSEQDAGLGMAALRNVELSLQPLVLFRVWTLIGERNCGPGDGIWQDSKTQVRPRAVTFWVAAA